MTEAEDFWEEVESEPAPEPPIPESNGGDAEPVDGTLEQRTDILTHQAWDGLTEVL